MTLSALICAKNEETSIGGCIERLIPFVDQIVVIDNGSSDNTKGIASSYQKVELYDFPETNDMSSVRNFSLSKATGDWILQCDPDEWYPEEEINKIRAFIETAEEKGYISARVRYKNLAWRAGYAQEDFGHYPDRLYRRDAVEGYRGVLPIDMTYVKKEHLLAPNKKKGDVGVLEYDNEDDISFVHPKQPILDVTYYHLARTRGYFFEYRKQMNYQRILHPEWSDEQCREQVIQNHWVTGRYPMEPVSVPKGIPKKTIVSPRVSVVVTNFEYEKYVGEAIQSVINQTYQIHEIIVVDDCSYDNSREVIDRYNVRKIYRKENGGPGAARNEGIAASTGDYFLLLDADDRLKPDAVENMVKGIGDSEVCYGDMESFGDRVEKWSMPDYTPEGMLRNQLVPSVCALIERHAFDASGGFPVNTHFEDWFFFLTLSHTLKLTFVHMPIVTIEYRFHQSEQKCRSDHANPLREQAMEYFKCYFPMDL
jgi:glycosyltransferase involved in cell wall biosynthesis